ncbi:MAG: DUF1592 domain-containing protein [Phycisphaeraceae bacterium]|nr:DUF1592 domain-containing protein [Phycisphaeraceae bacterium]
MKNPLKLVTVAALLTITCVASLVSPGSRVDAGQGEPAAGTADAFESGLAIYAKQCAVCHGEKGEGVEGKYEKPLGGERTLAWLTRRVERTMPEADPDECVGEDAAAVSAYLYESFYSPEARAAQRRLPARSLQRLTVEQHRQTLADLIASFREQPKTTDQHGLWVQYYPSRGMRKNPLAERVEPVADAVFKPEHPMYDKFDKKGHSVRWSGSLLAPETGEYEIIVHSDHAIRLWLNDGKALGGGISNEITDTKSVALLDGWLQSEGKTEFRAKTFLLAGRAYPIMLEFSAHTQGVGNKDWHKDQAAKNSYLSLRWVAPGGVEQVIPEKHLKPQKMPEVFIAANPFPPDDASMGFISGAGVSEAWLSAATEAAIHAAGGVVGQIDTLAKTKPKSKDRRDKIIAFCERFVSRAFRRPLNQEETQRHVMQYFSAGQDIEQAVKRVVLAALLSPRFLYPQAGVSAPDAYDAASALALAMWDSLPDQALREAATKGGLVTPQQIEQHARRMLKDPRAKAKLMRFFHHWLELERAEYADKDSTLFPEFDEQLLADLRTSLDLFLEHTVFSERSDYRELLLADYLYVNDRLAEVYGVDRGEDTAPGFTRVKVPADRRSGVITHPYLLTAFAYHNSTSPIHRGVFLTRNIIGRPLNPPPNAIAFEGADFDPDLTMREKVTAFTRDSACMACHETINPLGFSLENYDSLGRWRTRENDKPINAESDFTGDDGKTMRLKGARDVANYAIQSKAAHRAFVRLLFQHIAQRDPSALSPKTLDQLTTHFETNGYQIQDLFIQIAVENTGHRLKSQPQDDSP